jgi:hypothetical protein
MAEIKNPSGISLLVPSVQELAKNDKISTVPARYNQPHKLEDPVLSEVDSILEIPVIDMHKLISKEFGSSELIKLHLACKDWGFFQVYFLSLYFTILQYIYRFIYLNLSIDVNLVRIF